MANLNINTFTTTAQSLVANESALIGQAGGVSVIGNDAISIGAFTSSRVINAGSVFSAGSGFGIDCAGTSFGITNMGSIAGGLGGIRITTTGVTGGFIYNSGLIVGGDLGIFAGEGILNSGGLSINNSGQIIGVEDSAIQSSGFSAGEGTKIHNSGVISVVGSSGNFAISMALGEDFLQNSGLIGSHVSTGGGRDEVFNTGQINGDVDLGAGDDLFDGRLGHVQGSIFGGLGNDVFMVDGYDFDIVETGSDTGDEIRSTVSWVLDDLFENLTLLGSNGLSGTGNEANNVIIGNTGANVLRAFEGNDQVFGSNGRDTIFGGVGNDSITGGAGADVMNGDIGLDDFVFIAATDSRTTAFDKISGFISRQDDLDFSALVAGTFGLQLGRAYAAGGAPQVRTEVVGRDTRVFVDINGDRVDDMRIDLIGITRLVAGDFIL